MQKVLERQLGALGVDLDSEGGWVKFGLAGPQIDLAGIAQAMEDANYTLRGMEFETVSEVVAARGDALSLRVEATGQLFDVRGSVRAGDRGRIRAVVTGWPDGPFVLTVPE